MRVSVGEHGEAGLVLRGNSRSFSIAARFLPRRVRGKVQALYAWCRAVDDAVDNAASYEAAERELGVLAEDLKRISEQDFTNIDGLKHPASRWIAPLIDDGDIDPADAADLMEGMKMDLRIDSGEWSIDNEDDLLRYCYHAAGVVGLMMTQMMGDRRPAARKHAVALGIAMQLTNIARDVREDAERGRSYLPGIAADSISSIVSEGDDQAIRKRVARLLSLSEDRYRLAGAGLHYLPSDCTRAIRVALAAYREIGREIQRHDCRVLSRRTIVPKHRLLFVVTKATLTGVSSMSETNREKPSSASSVPQCKSAVWLGLSLTAFMATALFMMVYVNPKSDVYSILPLVYAAASLLFAVIANRLSAWYDTQHHAGLEA